MILYGPSDELSPGLPHHSIVKRIDILQTERGVRPEPARGVAPNDNALQIPMERGGVQAEGEHGSEHSIGSIHPKRQPDSSLTQLLEGCAPDGKQVSVK